MDYGQTAQSGNSTEMQDFFTTGAGADFSSETPPEAENNLDSSNRAIEWDNAPARHRTIGNSAIHSPEQNHAAKQAELFKTPELGHIIDLEMPPGVRDAENLVSDSTAAQAIEDPDNPVEFNILREQRGSISPEALKTVEHAVEKFEKNKLSPEELVDLGWETTKAYLKNSFNRELVA